VARDYAVPGVGARTMIRLARHGAREGVLGAALLAAHELDGRDGHPVRVGQGPFLAAAPWWGGAQPSSS
jgi:hypothetical protein